MKRDGWGFFWVAGTALWLFCLLMSTQLWGMVADPFALIRYIVRLLVVVPVATLLALGAVVLFDHWTPSDWLEDIADDEHGNLGTKLATGIVVASLILSVFWLAIQG
jgi:hypothetical protein